MKTSAITLLVTLLFLLILSSTKKHCQNNTDIRYLLKQPSNIINYYSTCSEFSRRTCCGPKNFETITKKVKKVVESIDMSVPCRERITKAICSVCDGDWGISQYEGVCSSYCHSLYATCRNDYFIVDSSTQKIRACREEDNFCWKLEQIIEHIYGNETQYIQRGHKFCELLDLTLPEVTTSTDNCWNGQISADIKGRARKTVDFREVKANREKGGILKNINMKYFLYGGAVILLGCIAYKMYRSKNRYMHRIG